MSLDLLPDLRDSVLEITGVTAELAAWNEEPAVFTRRPAPQDAEFPICMISAPVNLTDQDGLSVQRPVLSHQIAFYGNKGAPGSEQDQTRAVERAAFAARQHFHRNRFSVQPTGYYVIDVRVRGPVPAPVDDENKVGRVLTVQVRLGEKS